MTFTIPLSLFCNMKAWIEQLEQIHSVSRPVAESIARHYPTPRSLFDLYFSEGLTERTNNSNTRSISFLSDNFG
jgi:hypothetical protein